MSEERQERYAMKEANGEKFRIPLAHVAFTLCLIDLTRFLTTVIFDFSVDNLIDALVDLTFGIGMTTTLTLIIVIVRARRKKRTTEA
ncbi:hypothetical protein [Streptomyces sp. SID12488]|uniref:hypothetical protein n=1 Tax=Streptomyces sp. SID12488 TaxID=2706040 RepID=UPI0013DC742B|nr:hypothetical protein [Streptomyces sp. SID12488]NEA62801.1 hypothetical protein [Streptomyces sp. SID12488]